MLSKINSSVQKIPPLVWQIICLVVAMTVFVLILLNRSPNVLRPLSMALRTGFGIVIPVTTLVIYAIFRLPGRWGTLLRITSSMSLFSFGLAGLWASGRTQSILLSGLIPISDAVNYYMDALRILHGWEISDFSAMRPFFAGFLSFLLWLSGRNLMVALAIFTAIAGLSCYMVCKEIHRTHGAEPAVFMFMLMFLYYRHHSGTSMSETLGVSVSFLGTALIWQGIASKKQWLVLSGIALIALALNIRPGAMFVLPLLVLWGSYVFRGQGKFSIKFLLWGVLLILGIFYLNKLMINVLAGPNKVAFANFAWALYGLASGGNSWSYIFHAHPELQLLSDTEVTPAMYRLVIDLILTEPGLIVKGALYYWRMFFSSSGYNAYSFLAGENFWVGEVARWSMYGLGILEVVKWLKNRQDPYASLAVVTALGVLASVPFVPPTDANRVRLYAATIPFFSLLPALGLCHLVERLQFRSVYHTTNEAFKYPAAVFSIVLVVLMITTPILLQATGKAPVIHNYACPPDMTGVVTRFDEGTSINVLRQSIIFLDWMPNFHASRFRRNAHSLADSNLIEAITSIDPQHTLFYALDFLSNREALVIIKTDQLPKPGGMLYLCGSWEADPALKNYRLFYVSERIGK